MPAFWTIFVGIVMKLIEPVATRVLTAIGLGMISYSGLNVLISTIESYVTANIGSMSANIYAILSLYGFGHAITVILSALTVRAYLSGMSASGSIVRSVWK